jgi:hypothetical protein
MVVASSSGDSATAVVRRVQLSDGEYGDSRFLGWTAHLATSHINSCERFYLFALSSDGAVALGHKDIDPPTGDRKSSRRPMAAFTIVQNEPFFLPIWCDYYLRYFEPSDVFILNHSSDRDALPVPNGVNVVPVHLTRSFDHNWLRRTVERFQRFLLQSYQTVLFAEADELICTNPEVGALPEYISSLSADSARCTGFNVVHSTGEPAVSRGSSPVLKDRRYWHFSQDYCKTLISRSPLSWTLGFHSVENQSQDPDPNLILVHLHRLDYARCRERHAGTSTRIWSEADKRRGLGFQNLVSESREFDEWFYGGADLAQARSEIPDFVRELI